MTNIAEVKFVTINNARYTWFHLAVFLLTFFSYSLFHASRKTFSNVKTTISEEWTGSCDIDSDKNVSCIELKPDSIWNKRTFSSNKDDAKLFLGTLDAIFLAAYSLGLFISGILGDRFNLRIVLFLGMTISSISLFIFGVLSEWFGIYNKYWYIIFWIINGFAQSTGWPAVVAVMGNWFGKSGRGFIFGIWSACASVGNIFGALMVASCLNYGYQYSFLITSSVLFVGGLIIAFGLVPSPRDIGLPDPDSEELDEKNREVPEPVSDYEEPLLNDGKPPNKIEKHQAIGFFQALLLPGVIMYSLCYACLKMVNYSFLFWLPFYLANKFKWQETVADEISIWYDVGGIVGGIIGGLVSDIIKKRSVVIFVMLTIAVPSLYVFSESSDSKTMNAFLMSVVGFFVGGAANMISATITADLGRQGPIQGNKEGLATVTGIVDGTGSVGAALGQLLVPLIQEKANWFYVFYLFITLCVLTNFCILKLFFQECKELVIDFRQRRRGEMSYKPINNIDEE